MDLIGCGILKNEINLLIEKNHWDLTPHYLCSSLHIDFGKLEKALKTSLNSLDNSPKVIVYGTCHPNIENFYSHRGGLRTPGQNCIELLLGHEEFSHHLSQGAFFLLEDWARRWELVSTKAFGTSSDGIREIFHDAHSYFLALKTPCSGDFTAEAELVSQKVGLPLRWMSIDLDNLELSLKQTFDKASHG